MARYIESAPYVRATLIGPAPEGTPACSVGAAPLPVTWGPGQAPASGWAARCPAARSLASIRARGHGMFTASLGDRKDQHYPDRPADDSSMVVLLSTLTSAEQSFGIPFVYLRLPKTDGCEGCACGRQPHDSLVGVARGGSWWYVLSVCGWVVCCAPIKQRTTSAAAKTSCRIIPAGGST